MLSQRLVCNNVDTDLVPLRKFVKLLKYLSVYAQSTGLDSLQLCARDSPSGRIDTGIVTELLAARDSLNLAIGTIRINYTRSRQRSSSKVSGFLMEEPTSEEKHPT